MSKIAESIVSPASSVEAAPVTVTEVVGPQGSVVPTPAPVVPDVKATPQEEDFSTRFAALSRKEKFLREEETRIKGEADKYKDYADLPSKAKENPLLILEKYGIDLDSIIAASLGADAPAKTVEEEIKAIRAELAAEKDTARKAEEDKKKNDEEAYQNSINEAVQVHKNSITDHVVKHKEKYELITLHGAEDLVWEVTEAHYGQHNEVLSPEQAADKVEDYLEQQIKKAMNLNRFKAKPVESRETGFQVEAINPLKRQETPTLTASMMGSAPDKSLGGLSMEESKLKAAALLKWK